MQIEKWRIKASGPIVVLFSITAAGQQVANAAVHVLGLGTATNLGFLFFLVGCIAALKTRAYIQRRSPEVSVGEWQKVG